MLPLNDPRWQTYKGGYRLPYDASKAIRTLMTGGATGDLWEELWNQLHHQGDVDQASYAAVPWLVEFVRRSSKLDWNALAMIATIEIERPSNATVSQELAEAYFASIQALPSVLIAHQDKKWDELVLQSVVACIALAHGHRWYAKAYLELDRQTAGPWFAEEFGLELED